MLEEVGYMDPTSPTEFMNKVSKALVLNRLAHQWIRPNREFTLPFNVQNPLESVEIVRKQEFFKPSKFVREQTTYFQTPRTSSFKQKNSR